MNPRDIVEGFDAYLAERSLTLEAVIIGGAALNLLGIISRATKDCDVLAPPLPAVIIEAAQAFAAEKRAHGQALEDDWLNNGPASLAQQLPTGWRDRLQTSFVGKAILFWCLGREDLLRSKLFALCDRGIDLGDCLALAPTPEELRALRPWVEEQDTNEDWPAHVRMTFADVARRLGHAV
jgi:hypothetical protein